MTNASNDLGYDPIDGRPSVTDSPPPYSILPAKLAQCPKFVAATGDIPYPSPVSHGQDLSIGSAIFHFIKGLQNADPNASVEEAEQIVTKLTADLYDNLLTEHGKLFKDHNSPWPKAYVSRPLQSPIITVFGRSKVMIGESHEAVCVDWITQSISNPEGFQEMGQLVQIRISEEMDKLNPGLMERASRDEATIDEVLQIIEDTVKQPN